MSRPYQRDVVLAGPGTPVAPARFKGRLSLFKYLPIMRENLIAAWPEEAFEQEFLSWGLPFRRVFVANSPEAVRHVLLVNADNYVKSAIAADIEPGSRPGLADHRRRPLAASAADRGAGVP